MTSPVDPDGAAWSARYESDDTPWDLGGAHPELTRRLAEDPGFGGAVGRAYVPGCGRAHDAAALAAAGWDVVASDLAPSVIPIARAALAPHGGTVILGDALTTELSDPVDLVFDHTFLCALPVVLRPGFGTMCDRVLGAGGQVISVVFPIGRDPAEGGPPHGLEVDDVSLALGGAFRLAETSGEIRVKGRGWPHRWGRWARS